VHPTCHPPHFPFVYPPVGKGVSFRGADTTGAVCIPHAAPVLCSFTPPPACIPDAAPCTAQKPNERCGRKSTCCIVSSQNAPGTTTEPNNAAGNPPATSLLPRSLRKQQTTWRETPPPRCFLPRTLSKHLEPKTAAGKPTCCGSSLPCVFTSYSIFQM
jgi:hypothetical protein